MDQLGRAFADNVHAEQAARLQREDHFHEAGIEPHDVAARGFAETRDAGFVGNALSRAPAPRSCRRWKSPAPNRCRTERIPAARARGSPKAWHAAMRPCSIEVEASDRKADDVAHGVDVRRRWCGSVALSTPMRPRSSAASPAASRLSDVGRAFAAGGEEHHLRARSGADPPARTRQASAPTRLDARGLALEAQRSCRGRACRG